MEEQDILINICTQTPTTDLLLSELENIKCRKKILYVHGIWHFYWTPLNYANLHNFLSKIYNNAKWHLYYKKVGRYIKYYDTVVQLHEQDDGNIFFKKNFGIEGYVIENAAQSEFFEDVKNEECDEPYAICISNYGMMKGQEMVLRAYAKALLNDPEMRLKKLIFVGSSANEYMQHLGDVYEELKQDNERLKVEFMCGVDRDKTIDLLKQASLFLFGSRGEKFPVVIVESMAVGVPFISTDVGVVRYFPGGLIVKNVDEMAGAIGNIMNDDNLYHNKSAEGRTYARQRMQIADKVDALEAIWKA